MRHTTKHFQTLLIMQCQQFESRDQKLATMRLIVQPEVCMHPVSPSIHVDSWHELGHSAFYCQQLNIPQTKQHEPEGRMLFRNVTDLLDVTPSNPISHPLDQALLIRSTKLHGMTELQREITNKNMKHEQI